MVQRVWSDPPDRADQIPLITVWGSHAHVGKDAEEIETSLAPTPKKTKKQKKMWHVTLDCAKLATAWGAPRQLIQFPWQPEAVSAQQIKHINHNLAVSIVRNKCIQKLHRWPKTFWLLPGKKSQLLWLESVRLFCLGAFKKEVVLPKCCF